MKRQIIIKLFNEEIVNVLIEETNDESEETEESEFSGGLPTSIDLASSGKNVVGFNTPWSVEYWEDED